MLVSFVDFLDSYKTVLGGLSIAIATVMAVYLNYQVSKKTSRVDHNKRVASIAGALACELMDNTDNLIDLYHEIQGTNTKKRKIIEYQEFQTMAYQTLLSQIGEMGAPLSFIIVDVYGDLNKLGRSLELVDIKELAKEEESYLLSIKETLAKALTTSIVVILYSDYMNGPKYTDAIKGTRKVWIEQTLDTFCSYVSETEDDLEFIEFQQGADKDFVKRFPKKEDRQQIAYALDAIDSAIKHSQSQPSWKAPLIFRALSYNIHRVLAYFLSLEYSAYDSALEREYGKHLDM